MELVCGECGPVSPVFLLRIVSIHPSLTLTFSLTLITAVLCKVSITMELVTRVWKEKRWKISKERIFNSCNYPDKIFYKTNWDPFEGLLQYIAGLVLHVWRMVTENNVWRMILKSISMEALTNRLQKLLRVQVVNEEFAMLL